MFNVNPLKIGILKEINMKTKEQIIDNFIEDGMLLECRKRFDKGYNPTDLMNEMEEMFNIPGLDDPAFNEKHPKVIELYRKVSNSREF